MDERFGSIWRSKVVAMGTDEASVMIGKRGGVVRMISDMTERPFLKDFGDKQVQHLLNQLYRHVVHLLPLKG